ncbi:MAG TPA: hypothetical protein VIL65_07910 [Beijerinckiaceae bacterium]|jgi:hypothetical protein
MDLDRDNNVTDTNSRVYENSRGGSNFLAYLIGGLVIAVGLLAFLFYDGGSRDVSTTGSTAPRVETPASPNTGSTAAPSSPGSMGTPAPAGAPAAPARP